MSDETTHLHGRLDWGEEEEEEEETSEDCPSKYFEWCSWLEHAKSDCKHYGCSNDGPPVCGLCLKPTHDESET